jgi:hypothetical protein
VVGDEGGVGLATSGIADIDIDLVPANAERIDGRLPWSRPTEAAYIGRI